LEGFCPSAVGRRPSGIGCAAAAVRLRFGSCRGPFAQAVAAAPAQRHNRPDLRALQRNRIVGPARLAAVGSSQKQSLPRCGVHAGAPPRRLFWRNGPLMRRRCSARI